MANTGQNSFNADNANDIHINIDLGALADRLAADPNFVRIVTAKVRKEMTKNARSIGNLFGPWAGK